MDLLSLPDDERIPRLIEYCNKRNRFGSLIGMRLTALSRHSARMEMIVDEQHNNPIGLPHGAIYLALADSACGSLMMLTGYATPTLDVTWKYLKSAVPGEHVWADSRIIRSGRTVSTLEAEVQSESGDLLGKGIFSFFQTRRKIELE